MIATVDNPGWRARIGLTDTVPEARRFESIRVERNEHDWLHVWVDGVTLHAAWGPSSLNEVLSVFRDWASA